MDSLSNRFPEDDDDDDREHSFVSEGLADFVGKLNQTLVSTQLSLNAQVQSKQKVIDPVDEVIPPMVEDDEKIKMKQELMRKLQSPSTDAYVVEMENDDEDDLKRQLMSKFGFSADELGGGPRAVPLRDATPPPRKNAPREVGRALDIKMPSKFTHVDDFDAPELLYEDGLKGSSPAFHDDLQPPGLLYDDSFDDLDMKPSPTPSPSKPSTTPSSKPIPIGQRTPAVVDDFESPAKDDVFGNPSTPVSTFLSRSSEAMSDAEPSPNNPAANVTPNTARRMVFGDDGSRTSPSKPGIFMQAFKAPAQEEEEVVVMMKDTGDDLDHLEEEENYFVDNMHEGPHFHTPPAKKFDGIESERSAEPTPSDQSSVRAVAESRQKTLGSRTPDRKAAPVAEAKTPSFAQFLAMAKERSETTPSSLPSSEKRGEGNAHTPKSPYRENPLLARSRSKAVSPQPQSTPEKKMSFFEKIASPLKKTPKMSPRKVAPAPQQVDIVPTENNESSVTEKQAVAEEPRDVVSAPVETKVESREAKTEPVMDMSTPVVDVEAKAEQCTTDEMDTDGPEQDTRTEEENPIGNERHDEQVVEDKSLNIIEPENVKSNGPKLAESRELPRSEDVVSMEPEASDATVDVSEEEPAPQATIEEHALESHAEDSKPTADVTVTASASVVAAEDDLGIAEKSDTQADQVRALPSDSEDLLDLQATEEGTQEPTPAIQSNGEGERTTEETEAVAVVSPTQPSRDQRTKTVFADKLASNVMDTPQLKPPIPRSPTSQPTSKAQQKRRSTAAEVVRQSVMGSSKKEPTLRRAGPKRQPQVTPVPRVVARPGARKPPVRPLGGRSAATQNAMASVASKSVVPGNSKPAPRVTKGSSTITVSSRLMQPTQSSRAHHVPRTSTTATGTREPRHPKPSSKAAVTSRLATNTPNAAVQRARERTRQRKEALANQTAKTTETAHKPTETNKGKPSVTAEEARAKARERVKLRAKQREEFEARQRASIEKRTTQRLQPSHKSNVKPAVSRTSRRQLTVPSAPKLSTSRRSKVSTTSSVTSSGAKENRPAPVKRITMARLSELSRPLHPKPKVTHTPVSKEKRVSGKHDGPAKTISMARLNELAKPAHPRPKVTRTPSMKKDASVKDNESVKTISMARLNELAKPIHSRVHRTPGHHPSASAQQKHGTPFVVSKPKNVVPVTHYEASPVKYTVAEQMARFARKDLRASTPVRSTSNTRPQLTTPVPFKFHSSKCHTPVVSKIEAPQRTAAEQVNLFMQKGLRESTPRLAKRELTLTIPKSPNFTPITRRSKPKSTEEREKEMMEYYKSHPFKAAPVMKGSASGQKPSAAHPKRKPLTRPQPFHLRTDARGSDHPVPVVPRSSNDAKDDDSNEMKKQFKARPLPNFSAGTPTVRKTPQRKVTTPQPFKFSTNGNSSNSKSVSHQEMETSSPKVSEPATQSLASNGTDLKARMRAVQDSKRSTSGKLPKSPGSHLPFYLRSEMLQQEKEQRMKELREHEQVERRKMSEFHATPMLRSPPPKIHKSTKRLTQPQPFHLISDDRHEQHQRVLEAKLEEEEVEQHLLSHPRARKIPSALYNPKPIVPNRASPVKPLSPKLRSSRRVQERKETEARDARIREAALHGAAEEGEAVVIATEENDSADAGASWENFDGDIASREAAEMDFAL